MSVLPLARNTAVPEDDEAPARVKPKKAPTDLDFANSAGLERQSG